MGVEDAATQQPFNLELLKAEYQKGEEETKPSASVAVDEAALKPEKVINARTISQENKAAKKIWALNVSNAPVISQEQFDDLSHRRKNSADKKTTDLTAIEENSIDLFQIKKCYGFQLDKQLDQKFIHDLGSQRVLSKQYNFYRFAVTEEVMWERKKEATQNPNLHAKDIAQEYAKFDALKQLQKILNIEIGKNFTVAKKDILTPEQHTALQEFGRTIKSVFGDQGRVRKNKEAAGTLLYYVQIWKRLWDNVMPSACKRHSNRNASSASHYSWSPLTELAHHIQNRCDNWQKQPLHSFAPWISEALDIAPKS